MIRSPICSLGVGGGVWRLKSHHLHPDLLLVAAMHSGFHILQVNPSEGFFSFSFFFKKIFLFQFEFQNHKGKWKTC